MLLLLLLLLHLHCISFLARRCRALLPPTLCYPLCSFRLACLQPITKCFNVRQTLMLPLPLPRSICNILVACHVALRECRQAGGVTHFTHSFTHSLIHSVVYADTHATFIHTNSRRRSHECICQWKICVWEWERRLGKFVRTLYVENKWKKS